jgi:asparagine synthase (glutamine-hydrolysing)
MGFAIPLAGWLRGPLREMLWDHLDSPRFSQRGICCPEFVRHLLSEHQSGRRDNRSWLWALLVLEMWFRDFESQNTPCQTELAPTLAATETIG